MLINNLNPLKFCFEKFGRGQEKWLSTAPAEGLSSVDSTFIRQLIAICCSRESNRFLWTLRALACMHTHTHAYVHIGKIKYITKEG